MHAEERRATVVGATQTVKLYVIAVVITAFGTIAAVIGLAVFVPSNPTLIPVVVGITAPIILALIAGGQHSMAVAMDGKLSHLLRVTGEKERAQGLVEGLKENPNINLNK